MPTIKLPMLLVVSGLLTGPVDQSWARPLREPAREPVEDEAAMGPAGLVHPTRQSDGFPAMAPIGFPSVAKRSSAAKPVALASVQGAAGAGMFPIQDNLTGAPLGRRSAGLQMDAIPSVDRRPPEVAPLFEQPGVLTPRGRTVIEPIIQFNYSSSPRIAVMGYTIIPTMPLGLIDLREVRRNSTTATFTARRGITNRLEVEVRIPYVYRSDTFISPLGGASDRLFEGRGKAIGDAELAARYQFNEGGLNKPHFVGSLRFKSRTGHDPFEVVTDCVTRCVGPGASGLGLQLDLPTGSGFYALEPGLIWVMPSDPAIFFGTFSYMHNFKRRDLSRTVQNGGKELLGEISPGSSFQVNVGMGFALNDKASVSFGYDHNTIGRARQNGQPVLGTVRTQLGTIMVGFSYRIDHRRTINVSVGGGLTRDTPDVSMMVRIPMTF